MLYEHSAFKFYIFKKKLSIYIVKMNNNNKINFELCFFYFYFSLIVIVYRNIYAYIEVHINKLLSTLKLGDIYMCVYKYFSLSLCVFSYFLSNSITNIYDKLKNSSSQKMKIK